LQGDVDGAACGGCTGFIGSGSGNVDGVATDGFVDGAGEGINAATESIGRAVTPKSQSLRV